MQPGAEDIRGLPIADWIRMRDDYASPVSRLVLDDMFCTVIALRLADGCFRNHKFFGPPVLSGDDHQHLARVAVVWLQHSIVRLVTVLEKQPDCNIGTLHEAVMACGVRVRDELFASVPGFITALQLQTVRTELTEQATAEAHTFTEKDFSEIRAGLKHYYIMLEAATVLLLFIQNSPVVSVLQHRAPDSFVRETFTNHNDRLWRSPNFDDLRNPAQSQKLWVLFHTSNVMRIAEPLLRHKLARQYRVIDIASSLVEGVGYFNGGPSLELIRREAVFESISGSISKN